MKRLKMKLEPSGEEAYIPEIDGYLSIHEDGAVMVKKPSGQEALQCGLWHMEAKRIRESQCRIGGRVVELNHCQKCGDVIPDREKFCRRCDR